MPVSVIDSDSKTVQVVLVDITYICLHMMPGALSYKQY